MNKNQKSPAAVLWLQEYRRKEVCYIKGFGVQGSGRMILVSGVGCQFLSCVSCAFCGYLFMFLPISAIANRNSKIVNCLTFDLKK